MFLSIYRTINRLMVLYLYKKLQGLKFYIKTYYYMKINDKKKNFIFKYIYRNFIF